MSNQDKLKNYPEILPMFSPEDIRQFVYCPRIIYFRYVLRARVMGTIKMKRGSRRHSKWKEKQIRRGENTDTYYGIFLENAGLGLFGLIDAIDYDGKVARPIELKTGKHSPSTVPQHHRGQIVAECVLVESCLQTTVDEGVVLYESSGNEVAIEMTDARRVWLLKTLEKMRQIVTEELIPSPLESSPKCTDCEYWAVCRAI